MCCISVVCSSVCRYCDFEYQIFGSMCVEKEIAKIESIEGRVDVGGLREVNGSVFVISSDLDAE